MVNKIKKIFVIFFIYFVSINGKNSEKKKETKVDTENSIEKIKQDLLALQSGLKLKDSVSLEFSQVRYSALRKKNISSKGKAVLIKPEKFRWSFITPAQHELIYDGSSLLVYYPEEKSATRYGLKASKGKEIKEIVSMVLNLKDLLSSYSISKAQKDRESIFLLLYPKKKLANLDKVSLKVSLEEKIVTDLTLFFKGGNYLKMNFSKFSFAKVNPNILSVPSKTKIAEAF